MALRVGGVNGAAGRGSPLQPPPSRSGSTSAISSDTRPSDVVDLFETLKPIYAEISDPMRTVTS
jgi:hypothetical protein